MRIQLIVALLFPFLGMAQTGIDKPIYQINAYRDTTFLGSITMELFPLVAPLHVNNFDSLVAQNFFDSTAFHRVVPGFVIQGGDPNSISGPISTWGQGQPSQPTVPAEFSAVRHLRGIVGAARDTNINSANSQFYICVANATFLDGNYTVFGRVIQGMEVVDTIVASPRDANDVPLQKISMFIDSIGVSNLVPDSVTLADPPDQAVNVANTQLFRWISSLGAVLYIAEFATDSLFSNIVLTRTVGAAQATASTLPASSKYYWRVRANNGGRLSPYSVVRSFTTLPGGANLVSPPDSAVQTFTNPVFTWNSVPYADNYRLQVATLNTFSSSSLVADQTGITDTTFQVASLLNTTRYYWRVRSYSGTLPGLFSAKYTFETGTLAGFEGDHGSLDRIRIYPNPADREVVIETDRIRTTGAMRILLRDLTGREILSSKSVLPHDSRVSIDVSLLPPGMYVLGILQGDQSLYERLVIE
ncbi:MAG: peptidylprolyl isomerase [Bacteroidota bacterium]